MYYLVGKNIIKKLGQTLPWKQLASSTISAKCKKEPQRIDHFNDMMLYSITNHSGIQYNQTNQWNTIGQTDRDLRQSFNSGMTKKWHKYWRLKTVLLQHIILYCMYYLSLSPVIIIIFHYSGLGQLIVAFYMNVTTVINRDEKLAISGALLVSLGVVSILFYTVVSCP